MARLLTLAVEAPGSLLARLGALAPPRRSGVRPAARIGRRKWQRVLLATAALIGGASGAAAQSISWSGNAGNDWNEPANWIGGDVPDTAGEQAIFGSAGNRSPFFTRATTVDGITFAAGGSQYFISNNGFAVTFTSDIVSNSGEQFIYSNKGGVDVAFSANAGNITLISTSTPGGTSVVGTPGGGFRFDTNGQAGQAQIRFAEGGPLTVNTGASTTLNVGSLAGSGTVRFESGNQTLSVGGLNLSTVYSGVIGTGAGAATAGLTKVGVGTLVLTGDNTYGGGTTVSGGTLQVGGTVGGTVGGATGSLAAGSNVSVAGGATLALARTGTLAFGNNVSGAGAVTVLGGTAMGDLITLSGALTQTGGFTVANAANVALSGQIDPATGNAVTIAVTGGTFTNQNGGLISSVDGRGVSLGAGGTIDNQLGGTIRHTGTADNGVGNDAAVYSIGNLTLTNGGFITTTSTGASDGVTVLGTATITNTGTRNAGTLTGGLIQAANASGIAITGAGSSITNSGVIQGGTSPSFGYGVAFVGGTITNQGGGVITGTQGGVSASSGTATVDNNAGAGISGATGVRTTGAGTALAVTNAGNLVGTSNAINAGGTGAATITNLGTIGTGTLSADGQTYTSSGTGTAIVLSNGGTITNGSAAFSAAQNAASVINGATAIDVSSANAATIALNAGSATNGVIASSGAGARTVTVAGALNGDFNGGTGTGVVNFTLGAAGAMQRATFGDANDTFTYQGGTVGGVVDAGTGTDAFVSALGAGGMATLNQANLTNFESYAQQSGTLTLTGINPSNVRWDIQGGALNVAGTLSTSGVAVSASNGTILRVAPGGLITNTSGITINGSGAFTIVNAGTIRNTGDGSDVINTGARVTLLNTGAVTNTAFVAANANGAGSRIVNAQGGSLTGGSSTQYGIGANLGAGGTIDNYGTISGGATLAGGGGTLSGSTGITANLYAGSSTGTVLLGAGSTLSLYTGTGTTNVAGVTTTDPVTGATVILQNAGANPAATVGGISLGAGGVIALRGTGDNTSANGAAGALNMSAVASATTLNKQDSGTFVLTGGYGGALTTNVLAGRLIERVTGGVTSTVFGTGTVDIASGAVVELNGGFLQGVNTFTGAGRIEKTGAGEVRFGSGAGQTVIQQSVGGVIDVQAGLLRGSSSGNGIWTNNQGSLNIATGAIFDGIEGAIFVDGLTGNGTLQGGFGGVARTTTIGTGNSDASFGGIIQNAPLASRSSDDNQVGVLALTKLGTGTQTLSGTSTYSGATTISGGTLRGGAPNSFSANSAVTVNTNGTLDLGGFNEAIGSLAGAGTVTNSGAAATLSTGGLNQSPTFSGIIRNGAGTTALTKTGVGTLTLTGANTYTGATTISGGTLQIGDGTAGGDAGRIGQDAAGTVFSTVATTGGTLAFNRTIAANYTFGGTITGSGIVNQIGTGTTTLTGTNSAGNGQFTGTANVTAGTLAVNGVFGDTVGRTATINVNTAGTLHGSGTIAGSVVVGSGGIVSAGNSPGTMNVAGNYTLGMNSTSLFEMGSSGVVGGPNGASTSNDLINVGGNLTLGGTLQLVNTASPATPIVTGYYRLFNYNQNNAGGTLTGAFDTVTVASGSNAEVYATIPNQVNVLVRNGTQVTQFWDGGDATGGTTGDGGGTGTWTSNATNWTTRPGGEINDQWRSGVGIFGGTAGTVTVTGTQSVEGLQFGTTGYQVAGGSLNLTGNPFNASDPNSFITVDAGVSTTIASTLVGSATVGLTKLGDGTLVLTGNNGYSGGTVFSAGTLNVGSANAIGTTGPLAFTGGTLQYSAVNTTDYSARFSTAANQAYRIDTNGQAVTYATGLTSPGGSLTKLGAGTLTLTGASTYTGATTISAGTLRIGNGGTTGALAAASPVSVAGGATLELNRSGTLTFGNAVSGAGALTVRGATGANDLITLSGALRQTGGFTVADASNVTLSGSYVAAVAGDGILLNGGRFTNQGTVTVTGGPGSNAILTSTNVATTVVNAAGARIEGLGSAVIQNTSGVAGALTVDNAGLIKGDNFDGVTQHGTGALTVTNAGTGVIYGQNALNSGNGYGVGSDGGGVLTLTNAAGGKIVGQYGAVGSNAGDRITNAGTIASGSYDEATGVVTPGGVAGIQLRAGGAVTNQAGGVIRSGLGGVQVTSGTLTVDNAGTIAGGTNGSQSVGTGIATTLVNRAGGSVTGGGAGLYAGTGANQGNTISLVNAGSISATSGVGVGGAGGSGLFTIVNANGATIQGGGNTAFAQGIQLNGAAGSTVDNYGTIAAGSGTPNAINSTNNASTINLYAGSTVTGGIALGGGNDTVALYTGTGTANTNAVTLADPVLGGANTITLRAAGTFGAASFGAISLGGGSNTLSLRGTGDGTAANGVAGTLALGTVSGAGTFNKLDTGTWTLTGQTVAPLAGMTANVNGGTLAINGVFGDTATNSATVTVNTGGTLHGSGTVAGSVVVNNGGTVSAGNSPGTLTVAGNYTLNAGSTSLFELGASGVVGGASNDLINVGGNLTLGGTLTLVDTSTPANPLVSGSYRLFNYAQVNPAGTVSGSFATVNAAPGSTALVYTTIPTQVNVLLSNGGQSVQFWDGADTTGAAAGGQGGTGTWNATNTNWTTLPGGQINDQWRSGVGIFGGTAGTVTVAGTQNVQGLQFTVDGYRLTGGTINLAGDPVSTPTQSFINVDGGVSSRIETQLGGTAATIGLRKIGAGTLVLAGNNTFTGQTRISAGTLEVQGGQAIANQSAVLLDNVAGARLLVTNSETIGSLAGGGAAGGTVAIAAGQVLTTGADNSSTTFAGVIGGAGGLAKTGTGTFTLSAANTFTGGTLNQAGTLVLAAGGSLASGVTNNAGATFLNNGTVNADHANAGTSTNNGAINGNVGNTGTFTNTGSVAGRLTNAGGATNNGAINGGVTNTGTFANTAAGTVAGGLINNAGTTTNDGLIVGGATVAAGSTLTTNSRIDGGISNAGTVNARGQANGSFANTGTLTLTGGLTGLTRLTNDGTVDLGTNSLTIGSLAGSTAAALIRNGRTLSTGGDGTSSDYAGQIAGGGTALTKQGAGTFTLSGNNTYGGATQIQAGTLAVSATGLINGSSAILNDAGFQIAAGGQVTTATLTNNASLTSAGALTASSAITNNGRFTVSDGTLNTPSLTNAAAATLTQTGGTIGAGTFTNAATATFTQSAGALNTATTVNNGSFTAAGPVAATTSFTNNAALTATGTLTTPTFVNTGTVTGLLTLAGVAQITNTAGAVLRDGVSLRTAAGGATLDNAGTIGSGGLVIDVAAGSLTANNTSGRTFNGYVSSAAGTTATFNNTATGRWTYQGTGNLLGTDTINNAGLFEVSAAGGTLNGLEAFNNQAGGSVLLNASLGGPISSFNNAGTVGIPGTGGFNGSLGASTFNNLGTGRISLQNGLTTDRLALTGSYAGSAGSRIAIDVDLSRTDAGQRGDVLAIAGANGGASLLSLNYVSPRLAFFTTPIPVVQAGGGAGQLQVDPATPLPTSGFITYALQASPGSAGSYEIVSRINPGQAAASVSGITGMITSLNVGFFQSISAFISGPAEHRICTEAFREAKLCEQQATGSVGVTSSDKSWAQLNRQAAAAPVAAEAEVSGILPDTYGLGLWARGSGGETTIRSASTADFGGGATLTGQNRTRIGFAGFQLGGDVAVFNIANSGYNLHLGLTGGEVYADGRELVSSQASGQFRVPFFGAYAAVTSGPFTSDVSWRHDFYEARISDVAVTAPQGRLPIGSDTIAASAGYRFDLPGLFGGEQAYFLEPSGSISYTETRVGSLAVTGGVLGFQPIESILGRVGFRVGTTLVAGEALALQPFATASVWNEFAGNAASRFIPTASLAAVQQGSSAFFVPILTNRIGTFGQVGVGITGQLLGTDLLGYVRGDVRFGERLDGYSINGGIRYPF
ncbi:autotransporter-associated beta strand repeat-containing protein [Methylobacterium segetis]|uniref:autotransporter-associated beta strand repeat-containing protein n=1 Tax=Methylobacterium segetis TaxID=2488750 RepID=UPI001404B994|nr:autotransporter-associated beta strand repeat-containing protein [Methylobacterium segetis]